MASVKITAIAAALAASVAPAAAQTAPPPTAPPPTAQPVTVVTIRAAQAGNWIGQLEYRDYQADRWFGLPLRVVIEVMRDGLTVVRHADFDDGPTTGIVTITSAALLDPASNREQSISFRKGRAAELETATLTLTRADAVDRWTIEEIHDGRDDERPARIRLTTRRDGATMVTLKEVDFLDDKGDTWLTRNRTTLTKE